MDLEDPTGPKVVHAFLTRDTPGYRIMETWDTLGMRATRSDDTILEGAFVPDRYIARVVAPGGAGIDGFVGGLFVWVEPTFANIYIGIAERARDLAIAGVKKRTSIGLGGRSMAYHPMIQHSVAEMVIEIEAMRAYVDRVSEEWDAGVDHGLEWSSKLVGVKYRCVEGAKRVVDLAMDVSGGAGMFKRNELERLYRDVRAGGFHPANSALVHEIVGKTALGVMGEEPRW
jgi:alkylation response protein AidB-like acyl-CoA dehydrogenase